MMDGMFSKRFVRRSFFGILIFIAALFSGVLLFLIWALRPALSEKDWNRPYIRRYGTSEKKKYEPGLPLKVISYNIGFASGVAAWDGFVLDEEEVRANLDDIADLLEREDADIVLLQEVDFASRRTFYINQLDYLAEKAHYPYAAYIYLWDLHWLPYPYTVDVKQQFGTVLTGQVILSKYPILSHRYLRFPKPEENPFYYNWFYIDRAYHDVVIQLSETVSVRVGNVHLEAFKTPERAEQTREMLEFMDEDEALNGLPTLVGGDFNALHPDTRILKGFKDEPDNNYAKDSTIPMMQARFQDVLLPATGEGIDRHFSFPSSAPNRRLDYLFFDPARFTVQDARFVELTGPSDHLPLAATLILK